MRGEVMGDLQPGIIKINGENWYVETKTGFDGPFSSKEEASDFISLVNISNAARIEFAGLDYAPAES